MAGYIALAAHVERALVIADPFCGSGTLMIEAALIADGIAPGELGRRYAWQGWSWLTGTIPIGRAEPVSRSARHKAPRIIASDSDPAMISIARRNARRAGVDQMIEFVSVTR